MSSDNMPDALAKRLGYALKRAQHALRLRMDEALRPCQLTTPQYAVLCAIQAEAGISNARLARTAFVTAQTMQGVLTNLERDGFIERLPDAEHGRVIRSELTGKGRETLLQAHAAVKQVEDRMTASVGADNVGWLGNVLTQCADDLSAP